MKIVPFFILSGMLASCTTIHFRSNNTLPVSFEGNPEHRKEVSIVGHRDFYFWGLEPDQHEVYIDEEVRKAGYPGLSKVILYEQKNPQDMLISILTFGLYLPRGYTITGFTSTALDSQETDDVAPENQKK